MVEGSNNGFGFGSCAEYLLGFGDLRWIKTEVFMNRPAPWSSHGREHPRSSSYRMYVHRSILYVRKSSQPPIAHSQVGRAKVSRALPIPAQALSSATVARSAPPEGNIAPGDVPLSLTSPSHFPPPPAAAPRSPPAAPAPPSSSPSENPPAAQRRYSAHTFADCGHTAETATTAPAP